MKCDVVILLVTLHEGAAFVVSSNIGHLDNVTSIISVVGILLDKYCLIDTAINPGIMIKELISRMKVDFTR